jgi:nickel-dependent lactate racemase
MRKTVAIPYGEEILPVGIEGRRLEGVICPRKTEICDEIRTLKDAITNPFNSRTFQQFTSDAKDILFIVNDATRPTPTAKIIDILHGQIRTANVKFIVATGMHREPTREEYEQIFGRRYDEFRDEIFAHDCRKDEDMVHLGRSRNGTEMWINRLAMDAHRIVVIGSVEPHYFGGYTGGRKSFLPGIAAFRTIESNHKMAMHSGAKPLALEGNPVHEDMDDAIDAISGKEIFCIMTVLDGDCRVYAATAGDIHDSFAAAVQKASEVFCVKVERKADIVVAVVTRPLDINLYQSQKAIYNGIHALEDNGIFILVSACREGVGPETYVELMRSCDSPREILEKVRGEYRLGYHQAERIARISQWAQIWAVTTIDADVMRSMFIRPFSDPQEALDTAISEKGEGARVLFIMDAALTVPMLN